MFIPRRYRLFQLVVLLAGVLLLFINLVPPEKPVMQDQPDLLPFRINVREIQGEIVWPIPDVTVGLPISHIQDLGKDKPSVLLVIIVSSAPVRWERRDAIRQTWWKYCSVKEVACHFFTDGQVVNKKIQKILLNETYRYGDIEFQPLLGGIEFGLRFLYHAKWAAASYDFQYFLRTDDDYFLCLKKLLNELPWRPNQNLCWGHFHCEVNMTWVDESWMMFSRDIIDKFLNQDARTMLCHPHADQQIAMWLNNISSRLFFHDVRLNHVGEFDWQARNVCVTHMGVHRAFASRMLRLSKTSEDGAKTVPPISNFSLYCGYDTFDYKKLGKSYRYEPKPCVENAIWVKHHRLWIGEEGRVN